jgi:hypothetical protein
LLRLTGRDYDDTYIRIHQSKGHASKGRRRARRAPAVVALVEQDKATKRLIEDDHAKLPADHDYRRSV